MGDATVDTTKHQLLLSDDDVVERNPNYQDGYVVSFSVYLPQPRFLAHVNLMGFTNPTFPAFRRIIDANNRSRPLSFVGMSYGGTEGSFGAWNGQEGTTSAIVTIYVKKSPAAMAALATTTGLSLQSGWVSLTAGPGATGNFSFVGTNNDNYRNGGNSAIIGPIAGCAGLSDSQVDALYTAKKQYQQ